MINITVIIPAFNVEKYIRKSVLSALEQNEVREVIVVDDGSTDNTWSILNELKSKEISRLTILQHPKGINKGRSASRNLGLNNAKFDFIAFLDADDYYLPNRFKQELQIFNIDNSVDVVYNAVGYHFYRNLDSNEQNYFKRLNTVTRPIDLENQYECLLNSTYGYLHLNGITLKKSLLNNKILFNEKLKVTEDSEFILKLALTSKFAAGDIYTEVARRGIHHSNIYNNDVLYSFWNIKLYESLISWLTKNYISHGQIDKTISVLWHIRARNSFTFYQNMSYWLRFNLLFPSTIWSYSFFKYCPLIRETKKGLIKLVCSE